MALPASLFLMRSSAEFITFPANLIGGGAGANCTLPTDGTAGRTISQVVRTAPGRFTLVLNAGSWKLLGLRGVVHQAAGVAPYLVTYVVGSYNPTNATYGGKPTVDIQIFDMATPSVQDPAVGAVVDLDIQFVKAPIP